MHGKSVFALAFFILFASLAFATPEKLNITRQVTIPSNPTAGDVDVLLQIDLHNDDIWVFKDLGIVAEFQPPLYGTLTAANIPLINPQETFTVTFRFNISANAEPGTYAVSLKTNYTEQDTGAKAGDIKKVTVPISNSQELEFGNITVESKPYIGEYFQIAAYVQNKGALQASKITATAASNTSVISWLPGIQDAGSIPPGTAGKILFKGLVSAHAAPGAYAATFNLTYSNKSTSNTFVLDVYGKPKLRLAGITSDADLVVGRKVSFSIQLENAGTDDAKSVKASLLDGFKGTLDSYPGAIDRDDSASAIFDVIPQKPGTNVLNMKVEWEGKDGMKYSETIPVSLFVYDAPLGLEPIILLILIVGGAGYYLFRKKKLKQLLKRVE